MANHGKVKLADGRCLKLYKRSNGSYYYNDGGSRTTLKPTETVIGRPATAQSVGGGAGAGARGRVRAANDNAIPASPAKRARIDPNPALTGFSSVTFGSGASGGVSAMDTSSPASPVDIWFNNYSDASVADGDPDVMTAQGMMQLCEDIDVEPEDMIMLLLAYYCEASEMCVFTRKEFRTGMTKVGAHDVQSFKRQLPHLRSSLPRQLDAIYLFCYDFAKDDGIKSLKVEVAVQLWPLFFQNWPLCDAWIKFATDYENRQFVPKDTWTLLLDFRKLPTLADFDECQAWPVMIDDFVEHCQKTQPNLK